ncbi:RNA recognition motif domain-containing protein [Fibrobacterota bacterium]
MQNKIYVGNLPWDTDESQIRELFERYGQVNSVDMITDRSTGRSKGFCFVEMENTESAITELDGKDFNGRNLRVNQARQRPKGFNRY